MADMFDVLRSDHRRQAVQLDRLLASPHARSEQRILLNELTQELVMAASKHEVIEEMYVWPVVRRAGGEGETFVTAGLAQEQRGKWALDKLNNRTPGDPEFDDVLTHFSDELRQHMRFEEEQVWPWLAGFVGDAERLRLGSELEWARRTAPTRPHPAGPQSSGALRTVGVATGLVDRALDALTGRGRRFEE